MKAYLCFFILISGLFVTPVQAEVPKWLVASGRLRAVGPIYQSAVNGEFIVDYYNRALPWGTNVLIHYGFTKSQFVSGNLVEKESWVDTQIESMTANEPYKWGMKILKKLYTRGSETQLTKLNFVIEVRLPSGETFFEKGESPQNTSKLIDHVKVLVAILGVRNIVH